MKEKIKKTIKEEMKKNTFLSELFQKVEKIEIKMGGTILFEDVYVQDLDVYFRTDEGKVEKWGTEEQFEYYIWTKLGKKMNEVDWQMFDQNYPELAEEANKMYLIMHDLLSPELRERLLDEYIDNVHDYSTGEIDDFEIIFPKTKNTR